MFRTSERGKPQRPTRPSRTGHSLSNSPNHGMRQESKARDKQSALKLTSVTWCQVRASCTSQAFVTLKTCSVSVLPRCSERGLSYVAAPTSQVTVTGQNALLLYLCELNSRGSICHVSPDPGSLHSLFQQRLPGPASTTRRRQPLPLCGARFHYRATATITTSSLRLLC